MEQINIFNELIQSISHNIKILNVLEEIFKNIFN